MTIAIATALAMTRATKMAIMCVAVWLEIRWGVGLSAFVVAVAQ